MPMRTCVVTHEKLPKTELIRFVLDSKTNKVVIDQTGKSIRGRGASMTPSLEVFDQAIQRKSLNRALKSPLQKEDATRLRSELEVILKEKTMEERGNITVRVTNQQLTEVQNGKKEK